MRRILLVVGPLVAVGALLACESDSSSGAGGGFTVDEAGAFDAPAQPDAPAADGDVPRTGVTVSITRAGLPAAGRRVVFNDAAGAVLQVVVTGADGKATSTGVTPSMATALLGDGGAGAARRIVTWVDVKDGDVLSTFDIVPPDIIGRYDVSFGLFDGAASYTARSGACSGSGNSPLALALSRTCVNATNSVLGAAMDANGNSLAFAFAKGVVAPAMDGGVGAVTLGPWAAPSSLAVIVTNPPTQPIDGSIIQYSEGASYQGPTVSFTGGNATLPYTAGFADALEPTVGGLTPGGGFVQLAKRVAAGPTVTFDFATALPAILTSSPDTSDAKRPALTWTTAAPLSASDGGIVNFDWYVEDWAFVVPPNATSVKAPELPAEGAAWVPAPGALAGGNVYIDFVDVDSVPSYDVFRQGAGKAAFETAISSAGPAGAVLPQNGTARAAAFARPVP